MNLFAVALVFEPFSTHPIIRSRVDVDVGDAVDVPGMVDVVMPVEHSRHFLGAVRHFCVFQYFPDIGTLGDVRLPLETLMNEHENR